MARIISQIEATGIPVPGKDQDTDKIIQQRFLKYVFWEDLKGKAYFDDRFDVPNVKDPMEITKDTIIKDHPLNDVKYRNGQILLTGENYGCGSSRQHAPEALVRHNSGITGILATSFADIFHDNSVSIGLVPAVVQEDDLTDIIKTVQSNPETQIKINIEAEQVAYGSNIVGISFRPGVRNSFLQGRWSPLSILNEDPEAIAKTEKGLEYLSFK